MQAIASIEEWSAICDFYAVAYDTYKCKSQKSCDNTQFYCPELNLRDSEFQSLKLFSVP